MREDGLVLERLRRPVRAEIGRGLVRRVRSRPVRPVVGVDRHDVAVDEAVDVARVVAGDIGRELDVGVVLVLEVRDERDDLVTGAGVVTGRDDPELLEQSARAVARGRRAVRGGQLRVHVPVELPGEVGRLRVGDHVPDAVVAAVAGREVDRVRDPDLDLRADGSQRELLEVGAARGEVDQRPEPRRAERRARVCGSFGTGAGGAVRCRHDGARGRDGDLAVSDVDHVAERVVRERGRRHGEREGGQRKRKHCSSHEFLLNRVVTAFRCGAWDSLSVVRKRRNAKTVGNLRQNQD